MRLLRNRRRHPSEQRRSQLCRPPHPPPRDHVRQKTRPEGRVFRGTRRTRGSIVGRRVPRAEGTAGHHPAGDPRRRRILRTNDRPGVDAVRGRYCATSGERTRLACCIRRPAGCSAGCPLHQAPPSSLRTPVGQIPYLLQHRQSGRYSPRRHGKSCWTPSSMVMSQGDTIFTPPV